MFKTNAFSLIELLVVIAIIGIITTIGMVSLNNKPKQDNLEIAIEELISNIRLEQIKAGAVANCSKFGVERVDSSSYRLLCANKVISLKSGLAISGGNIYFTPPEPKVSTGSFTINSKVISINQNGNIQVQ